jgi:cellobiose phosphorylase
MIIKSSTGLTFEFLESGSVRSISADTVRISLKVASFFARPGNNLYLRKRSDPVEFKTLLGPESESRFSLTEKIFMASGSWKGIDYSCTLQLSGKSMSWQWRVDLKNSSGHPVELDVVWVQDIGLKPMSAGLINEYYLAQYLERRILADEKFGSVICCRQNMKEPTGHPWLMMACRNGAASASTDGMQFYGKTYRGTGIPEGLMNINPGGEYAGESSLVALQERPFKMAAGSNHQSIFVATYLPDHPSATSADDLGRLAGLMNEFGDVMTPLPGHALSLPPEGNLFHNSPFLPSEDLNDGDIRQFFGERQRFREVVDGRLLSFFSHDNDHVMLRPKELLADRPHGHILQTGSGFVPDENIMSTTAFAFGVFNSHLTQGNTNFNTLLSVCTSQFNQSPDTGQRIFVVVDGKFYLLGVPSAFEMGLNHCRWIYKYGGHCFQVRTWTSKTIPQINMDFRVIRGGDVRLFITHDFDGLNGWEIVPGRDKSEYIAKPRPESMIAGRYPGAKFRIMVQSDHADYTAHGDEVLCSDRKPRGGSIFVLDIRETSAFCMSFIGEVSLNVRKDKIATPDDQWQTDRLDAQSAWRELSMSLDIKGEQEDIAAIREILPWYGMNALVHFLTPYGLEQFGGAAWGTRDVSQGPVDLLLTMARHDEARQALRIIFSNQDPGGGWPQWWMFDRYATIRAGEAHGDIIYWCIIALSNYISVTGDLSILDEILPFYHPEGADHAEKATLREHLDRLIKMIVGSFIPGTALVPFGGGDWNDSLQPVSRDLAQRMVSAWTVEMNYQAFTEFRKVCELEGNYTKAGELGSICKRIRVDFDKYLVRDGVVAGYGLLEEDGRFDVLLHPGDTRTGICYSILPMNRGIISGIFTKEQALSHQDLVEQHLKGPDGARLMDRPLRYKGGVQEIFQRAESSTFFGREIGLMYVHEHIRYAESLAIMGKADAFMKALRQAIPVGYRDIVPCGDIRQANCYYSSSDAVFRNRYEADECYDQIKTGNITLRGGWRVYSSGPGIFISLVVTRLLGLRIGYGNVIIDPVMPASLDGFSASLQWMSYPVTFMYSLKTGSFSPKTIVVNGRAVKFTLENNTYREGGAVIPFKEFQFMLDYRENIVEVLM